MGLNEMMSKWPEEKKRRRKRSVEKTSLFELITFFLLWRDKKYERTQKKYGKKNI